MLIDRTKTMRKQPLREKNKKPRETIELTDGHAGSSELNITEAPYGTEIDPAV